MNANNNPLNIKQNPANPWKGSTGMDSRGHAIFTDPAMGIRAAMRSLQRKWENGKRTIRAIIADWAPADDTQGSLPGRPANDPGDYARFVSRMTGIGIDDEIIDPKDNPLPWASIMRAMSKYEMGEAAPKSTVLFGLAYWVREFVEGVK